MNVAIGIGADMGAGRVVYLVYTLRLRLVALTLVAATAPEPPARTTASPNAT
jgi:hypothetical protein